MALAKNIRFLRKKKNWSQDYIAEKLGYKSYTTIQKWEMGASEPPLKKLKELAELFHVDMDDLANKNLELSEQIHLPIDTSNFMADYSQNLEHEEPKHHTPLSDFLLVDRDILVEVTVNPKYTDLLNRYNKIAKLYLSTSKPELLCNILDAITKVPETEYPKVQSLIEVFIEKNDARK